jgi:hypothetical protein
MKTPDASLGSVAHSGVSSPSAEGTVHFTGSGKSAAPPSPAFLKLQWTFRTIALLAGVLQAWAFRYDANPDGVAYLDVADAYRERRWADAPNGYWSPLYSWLLAIAGALLRLPPSADFVLAHIVNLAAYVAALLAFEYLLRGIDAIPTASSDVADERRRDWWILGYSLFLWATLGLIGLGVTTPDLLLAGAAFAVAGILARIAASDRLWSHSVLLGVALGVGHLAKAAFLPVSIVVLAGAAVLSRRRRRPVLRGLIIVGTFAIVAGPYVAALSRAKGRVTAGESGRIAYAWIVNSVHGQLHWQGSADGGGVPIHPTRRISRGPEAYEFASPLRATYPPWYDPSYWYDGVEARFAPVTQARIALHYLPLLVSLFAPLVLVVTATLVRSRVRLLALRREWGRGWWLIVPGSVAIAMYATIFLESRYIAPFVVMVWLGALLVLEPFMLTGWRRALYVGTAMVLLLATLPKLSTNVRVLLPGAPNPHWGDAAFAAESGVRAGDAIAVVGDGRFEYWARLARVRIVAEVPAWATSEFLASTQRRRDSLLHQLRRTGARAVVSRDHARILEEWGWRADKRERMAVLLLP